MTYLHRVARWILIGTHTVLGWTSTALTVAAGWCERGIARLDAQPSDSNR